MLPSQMLVTVKLDSELPPQADKDNSVAEKAPPNTELVSSMIANQWLLSARRPTSLVPNDPNDQDGALLLRHSIVRGKPKTPPAWHLLQHRCRASKKPDLLTIRRNALAVYISLALAALVLFYRPDPIEMTSHVTPTTQATLVPPQQRIPPTMLAHPNLPTLGAFSNRSSTFHLASTFHPAPALSASVNRKANPNWHVGVDLLPETAVVDRGGLQAVANNISDTHK